MFYVKLLVVILKVRLLRVRYPNPTESILVLLLRILTRSKITLSTFTLSIITVLPPTLLVYHPPSQFHVIFRKDQSLSSSTRRGQGREVKLTSVQDNKTTRHPDN